MSRTILFTLVCALTAASCVGAPPRVQHARSNAKAHVYQAPLSEVWPYALQLLLENGFELEKNEARDEGARFSAETNWKAAGHQQIRLIVQGVGYEGDSSTVSFTRQTRNLGQSQVTLDRDLDMEWALIRLVDPEAAAEIEAAAPPPEE